MTEWITRIVSFIDSLFSDIITIVKLFLFYVTHMPLKVVALFLNLKLDIYFESVSLVWIVKEKNNNKKVYNLNNIHVSVYSAFNIKQYGKTYQT